VSVRLPHSLGLIVVLVSRNVGVQSVALQHLFDTPLGNGIHTKTVRLCEEKDQDPAAVLNDVLYLRLFLLSFVISSAGFSYICLVMEYNKTPEIPMAEPIPACGVISF
jgi:hypothetical protein